MTENTKKSKRSHSMERHLLIGSLQGFRSGVE